jgi:hypothetical protein
MSLSVSATGLARTNGTHSIAMKSSEAISNVTNLGRYTSSCVKGTALLHELSHSRVHHLLDCNCLDVSAVPPIKKVPKRRNPVPHSYGKNQENNSRNVVVSGVLRAPSVLNTIQGTLGPTLQTSFLNLL